MPVTLEYRESLLFENAKQLALKAARTPVFPEYTHRRFADVLDRTIIVDDEEFLNIGRSISPNPNIPGIAESITSWANNNSGITIRRKDGQLSPPFIAIRKAAFRQVNGHSYFFDLLAEEVAHAFCRSKDTPLTNIPDGSWRIAPCATKSILAEVLNEQRRDYFGMAEPIDPQKVSVIQEGFLSSFIEKERGRVKLHYFQFFAQHILEEARASIIQTILAATCFGISIRPKANFEEQFKVGLNVVEVNAQNSPQMHIRERAVLNFVKLYTREKSYIPRINSLMDCLYRSDIESFRHTLNSTQEALFMQIIEAAKSEFLQRSK